MSRAESPPEAAISEREVEVLAAVGERLTNAQIAQRLSISVRTVESHVSSLLRKLGAADRRELAERALAERDSEPIEERPPRVAGGRLPAALTTFVGREAERTALSAAIDRNRLVTALGPGGVGKTRLATEVVAESAGRRPEQSWFVDLVPVSDPDMVFSAVAAALGVAERLGGASRDAVLAWLAERDAILVLDNCEHVLAGAADCIDAVLKGSPGTRVLATSRARLLLPYEAVFEVPALSVDDVTSDAVSLFVERATAAGAVFGDGDLDRVARICRRLDGIALAIELAAARVPGLGLDGLEAGLDERLPILDAGPRGDDRHRSLRATLDWSCALLPPSDQRLLRDVSVFAASFTADAATAIADDSLDAIAVRGGLGRLADQSLLVAAPASGVTRYRMLETVRQYGEEELLRTGEHDITRRRHVTWAIATADGLRPTTVDEHWRETFDAVVDDLRTAARWSATKDDADVDAAFRLELALGDLLFQRGRPADAEQRYREASQLATDPAAGPAALRLAAGAAIARHAGTSSLVLLRQAADASLANGDRAGAAFDLAVAAHLVTRAPGIMAIRPKPGDAEPLIATAIDLAADDPMVEAAIAIAQAFDGGEGTPEAYEMAERAVELGRASGDPLLESAALDNRSAIHLAAGDLAAAVVDVERRVDLLQATSVDARSALEMADAFSMASEIHLAVGDIERARRYADAVADLPFTREEAHVATVRRLKVDAMAGRFDDVLAMAGQFRTGWIDAGRPVASNLAGGPAAVAMVHGIRGDDEARAEWVEITAEVGSTLPGLFTWASGWTPVFDAIVLLHHGDAEGALERLPVEPAELQNWYNGMWRPWYAALWVEAAVLAERDDGEERLPLARAAAAGNDVALLLIDRAEALQRGDTEALPVLADRLDDAGLPYQANRTRALAG